MKPYRLGDDLADVVLADTFRLGSGAILRKCPVVSEFVAVPRSSNSSNCPAKTDSTPFTAVPGPTTNPFHNTDETAAGSSFGFLCKPEANIARNFRGKHQCPGSIGFRVAAVVKRLNPPMARERA